jgi:hypothetical protein
MKRRGMHSSRSFFKPCLTPSTSCLSSQLNDGQLRAYPYTKERAPRAHFDQNSLKSFHEQASYNNDLGAREKPGNVVLGKPDRWVEVETSHVHCSFGTPIVSWAALGSSNITKETDVSLN